MTTGGRDLDAPNGGGLGDLLRLHGRALALGLRVAIPGRVVSYDPVLQRADVTPEILTVVRGNTPQTAEVETILPPVPLSRVPVVFPYGVAGGLTFPIAPGDTGLLVFADRSLERWKTTGVPGDPAGARVHSLSDGVFLPGLHADPAPIVPATDLAATVLEGPLVSLGRLATLGVARLTDPVAPHATMASWIAQVTALLSSPGVVAISGGLPLPVPPVGAIGVISGASIKVRAE